MSLIILEFAKTDIGFNTKRLSVCSFLFGSLRSRTKHFAQKLVHISHLGFHAVRAVIRALLFPPMMSRVFTLLDVIPSSVIPQDKAITAVKIRDYSQIIYFLLSLIFFFFLIIINLDHID